MTAQPDPLDGQRARLHVAFLLTQSLESPSGLGRYGPLARGLAKLGHRVEIYALHPSYTQAVAVPFEQAGVRVHYVAPMHVRKDGNRKTYYSPLALLGVTAQAAWRLSGAALRTEASILHVGKPHPMNAIAGMSAHWLGGKRLFVDCDDYEAGSNRFGGGWQRALVAGFERFAPRRALGVTANTGFLRAKLDAWGVPPERILDLPNGVEAERFAAPPAERLAAERRRLGLEGRPVVVYLGSLSLVNHPVDLLLRAFARLRAGLPQARLLIVGGGEDYDALRRQAAQLGLAEAAIFTGRIAPEDAALYYRLGDVSVDPVNDDEAARGRSPLKMFESWACGVPFVTSPVGDRASLLGTPPAGALARPGDDQSLADALANVLTDPVTAAMLAALGRRRAPAFAWDALARSLEAFYVARLGAAGR